MSFNYIFNFLHKKDSAIHFFIFVAKMLLYGLLYMLYLVVKVKYLLSVLFLHSCYIKGLGGRGLGTI